MKTENVRTSSIARTKSPTIAAWHTEKLSMTSPTRTSPYITPRTRRSLQCSTQLENSKEMPKRSCYITPTRGQRASRSPRSTHEDDFFFGNDDDDDDDFGLGTLKVTPYVKESDEDDEFLNGMGVEANLESLDIGSPTLASPYAYTDLGNSPTINLDTVTPTRSRRGHRSLARAPCFRNESEMQEQSISSRTPTQATTRQATRSSGKNTKTSRDDDEFFFSDDSDDGSPSSRSSGSFSLYTPSESESDDEFMLNRHSPKRIKKLNINVMKSARDSTCE
jgi:hypothetical protein